MSESFFLFPPDGTHTKEARSIPHFVPKAGRVETASVLAAIFTARCWQPTAVLMTLPRDLQWGCQYLAVKMATQN
jgi:hypothetical protein